MKTKNKIELNNLDRINLLINTLINDKQNNDNYISHTFNERFCCIVFKDLIYSGQINILINYQLSFYIQRFNNQDLILKVYCYNN